MYELLLLVSGTLLSGLVSFVVARATARHTISATGRAEAAVALVSSLERIGTLVEQADGDLVGADEFADAFVEWDQIWRVERHRLPSTWAAIDRDLRDAVGQFAGGVVASGLDRRMRSQPLSEPSWQWQTNAELYLKYLGCAVMAATHRRPRRPMHYGEWLAANDVGPAGRCRVRPTGSPSSARA